MHKIAPEPKELYKLWMDSSGAGVEEADLERRNHTWVRLNILFPGGIIGQPVGGA
jgi:hypothetical protein